MAVQLFLRNTASDLGGAGQKALSPVRGTASQTATTTTTASGTNIQVTTSAGGQALTWFSEPLPAQTLTGTVDVNIRGRESATSVNAGAGILIERTNGSGVVQSTILSDRTVPASITEYSTTDAAKTSSGLAITSTSIADGDRIKVTLKVRNVGTMAAGTVINTFDGPSGAAGDTYVTFSGLSLYPRVPPTVGATADLVEGIGTRVFASVSTSPGDTIIVQASAEHDNSTASNITPSAAGLTFILQNDSTAGSGGRSRVFQWTADDATGGTRAITLTPGSGSINYRGRVNVVSGATGVGAKANSKTAQVVSLARQAPNSIIFYNVNDWSTGAVGSPVWTPGGTTTASQQGVAATYIFGRWDDSGVVDIPANHGISSPSYTTPAVAVMEILGAIDSGPDTITGSAALSSESNLVVSGSVTTLPTTNLSVQSGLTVTGTVTKLGSSTLSGESGLIAAGIISRLGIVTLSSESALNTIGTISRLGVVTLSGQSTLTVAGVVSKLGTVVLSANSTLDVTGNTGAGVSVLLSGQSSLTVSGVVTKLGVVSLNAQSTLNSVGVVNKLGTVVLSGQSVLNSAALITSFGSASFSGQSTFIASGSVTNLGSITLSAQSNMSVSGTIGALPITANLSAISALIVSGVVTRLASVNLSGNSILIASARQGFFANAGLGAESSFVASGVVKKLGTVSLSATSTLSASAFIPEFILGNAVLSAMVSMVIDAQSSPPWVFTLIEFSSIRTSGIEAGAASKTGAFEGYSSTVSMEGG